MRRPPPPPETRPNQTPHSQRPAACRLGRTARFWEGPWRRPGTSVGPRYSWNDPAFRREQSIAKGMEFVVDLGRIRDRASDFLADNFDIAGTQPVNPGFHRPDTDVQRLGGVIVRERSLRLTDPDKLFQGFKHRFLSQ